MKRSMMQVYIKRSDEAVALYQRAFDTMLIDSYPNSDGTFYHVGLDVQGQILAVAGSNSKYTITPREVIAAELSAKLL